MKTWITVLKMYAVDAFAAKATRAIYDKMDFIQVPFCSSTFTRRKDHYEISLVELNVTPVPMPVVPAPLPLGFAASLR